LLLIVYVELDLNKIAKIQSAYPKVRLWSSNFRFFTTSVKQLKNPLKYMKRP